MLLAHQAERAANGHHRGRTRLLLRFVMSSPFLACLKGQLSKPNARLGPEPRLLSFPRISSQIFCLADRSLPTFMSATTRASTETSDEGFGRHVDRRVAEGANPADGHIEPQHIHSKLVKSTLGLSELLRQRYGNEVKVEVSAPGALQPYSGC